jgi:hypothetical protein
MAKEQGKAWVQLQAALSEARRTTGLEAVDPLSQRLWEWIAANSSSHKTIHMQTLVMESGVASPASIFKCADTLEREGLLNVTVDEKDARRRIISLTPKSVKLLHKLDQLTRQFAKKLE